MRYLTADEVARFAEEELGPDVLADRFLLEAAVERPRQSAGGEDAYPDVHTKAAALLHSIASNHAFVDGNKRMSLLAAIAFYGLNGYAFEADDTDLFHLVVDVAVGNVSDVGVLAEHLKKWAFEIPDPGED
jgi:death-on-curing protein